MLSVSHDRAYQDFLTLLTEFKNFVDNLEDSNSQSSIKSEFGDLERWFNQNITKLNGEEVELSILARWQSVQTEIKREFKLLTTDILFLASARQNATRIKRLKNISDRATKLIGYCQILLKNSE